MELNELMLDRIQEPHWRETARWIKFEEDVEEETERWVGRSWEGVGRGFLVCRKRPRNGELLSADSQSCWSLVGPGY